MTIETYKEWLKRIDNLIEVQKQLQIPYVTAQFSERELRDMRIIFSSLIEIEEQKNDR